MRRLPTLIAKSIIDEASKTQTTSKIVDISTIELYVHSICHRGYASSIPSLFDRIITASTATAAHHAIPRSNTRYFSSSNPSHSETLEKKPSRRARPGSGWSDQPRSISPSSNKQSSSNTDRYHRYNNNNNSTSSSNFTRQSSQHNDGAQDRRRYQQSFDREPSSHQRTTTTTTNKTSTSSSFHRNTTNPSRQPPRRSFDKNFADASDGGHHDGGFSQPTARRDRSLSKWGSTTKNSYRNSNSTLYQGQRNDRNSKTLPISNAQKKGKSQQKSGHPKRELPQPINEVKIPHDVTVVKLAHILGVSMKDLEKILSDLGDPPRSTEDSVSPDSAELAALELGKTAVLLPLPSSVQSRRHASPSTASNTNNENSTDAGASSSSLLASRPAVVTVMGHVDHGKTTLLDALRSTTVAAKEAGGITQHIGAFEVTMPGSKQSLTFLDTPGHAAFGAMRARGAAVTDLVVLVVAADDGVMPQTREALAHARASKCPIVVAITKCDVPSADPEKVKRQLLAEGLLLEGMGGEVQCVEVAAPKGQGLTELEEALLLEGEMLELKADPDIKALGTVVEAKVARGLGPVATVIVRDGTLRAGDAVVMGCEWGKVKILKSPDGLILGSEGVGPGKPAEVVGLKGLPLAGDEMMVVASEERAQRISKARTDRSNDHRHATAAAAVVSAAENNRATTETVRGKAGRRTGQQQQQQMQEINDNVESQEGPKALPIVVKADVQGSAEAVKEAIEGLSTPAVRVHVVHAGVGPITPSDVALAVPFDAAVVGFNVRPAADAESSAKSGNVRIVSRRIIYELLEDISAMVEGASPKEAVDVVVGSADVLAVFKVPGNKPGLPSRMVAGCRVVDGSVKSGLRMRVLRGGEMVHEAVCDTLKRHKLVVNVVGKGTECGIALEGFDGFELGDVLQSVDQQ